MNTWILDYTIDNPEMGVEVGCKLETTNPGAVPAILERFIKEGNLLEFHLTLNVPTCDEDNNDGWFAEDDDNYWDGDEE